MAATTAGAIKAHLEGAGLGISFFRDRAPDGQPYPYGTVSEGVTLVPDRAFNQNDDSEGHVREQVQIDLWQQWRNPTTRAVTESYTLPDATAKALKGAVLTQAPTSVSGVRLLTGPLRITDPDPNIVHHVITIELRRTLTRV